MKNQKIDDAAYLRDLAARIQNPDVHGALDRHDCERLKRIARKLDALAAGP